MAHMTETEYSQFSQYQDQRQDSGNNARKVPTATKPPVIKSRAGAKQLPIEESYEKWSRFENFLKFAEKKELKDRLKELDPPPLSNYVDSATIDSINKARKDPASLVKKPGKERTSEEE